MSSALQDPFTFASYSFDEAYSNFGLEPITANHFATGNPDSSPEGHLTITVNRNAIHVIDLASSHPRVSYTLGPDTQYACNSVSRNNDDTLETFAVVGKSPLISSQEEGRTIWLWKTSLRDPVVSINDREASVLPSPVHSIYAPRSLPGKLLVIFKSGVSAIASGSPLTIADTSSYGTGHEDSTIIKTFNFPGRLFKPISTPSATVLLTVVRPQQSRKANVRLATYDQEGRILRPASSELVIPDVDAASILDVTCGESGYLTILTTDLRWRSYYIHSAAEQQLVVSSRAALIQLDPSRFSSPDAAMSTPFLSALSLNTSRVLLAGVSKTSPVINLLVWDLQYSVLLAQRSVPLPDSQQIGARPVLLQGGRQQAILIVTSNRRPANGSANVLAIPYAVASSSLVESITTGTGSGREWLRTDAIPPPSSIMTEQERGLLQTLRVKSTSPDEMNAVLDTYLQTTTDVTREFVSEACAQFDTNATTGETDVSSLIRLLRRGYLSHSFFKHTNGVMGWFIERRQWSLALDCLKYVRDIPEDTLVRCLLLVLSGHLQAHPIETHNTENRAEKVPDPFNYARGERSDWVVPPLLVFLIAFIRYPTTPSSLKSALKDHISGDHITLLLMAAERILLRTADEAKILLPPPKIEVKKSRFALCAEFVQTLLDTFLLAILTNGTAQQTLASIYKILASVQRNEDLARQLSGPLEAFALAHAHREVQKRQQKSIKTSGKDAHNQMLKARTAKHRAADAKVSVYQVEQLRL